MPVLLSNGNATSNSALWDGGRGVFAVVATFGGGNVALQYLGPDESTWLTVGSALTANGLFSFDLPPGRIRAAVTTATGVYARADESNA